MGLTKLTDSEILDLLCQLVLPKKEPVKIGPNQLKHFTLKRLPNGPNGKVCWVLIPGHGVGGKHYNWNMEELRTQALMLPIGGTKDIIVR